MLLNILLGLSLIGITVTIQGYGTIVLYNRIHKKFIGLTDKEFQRKRFRILVLTASFLLMLHFLEASVWALAYYLHPVITEFETFEKAIYFSLVTFTTLGYGEITISSGNRIMAGIEAANGVLMLGWSTALMYATVQYVFNDFEKGKVKNQK